MAVAAWVVGGRGPVDDAVLLKLSLSPALAVVSSLGFFISCSGYRSFLLISSLSAFRAILLTLATCLLIVACSTCQALTCLLRAPCLVLFCLPSCAPLGCPLLLPFFLPLPLLSPLPQSFLVVGQRRRYPRDCS